MSFGERVRKLREKHNLTQGQLATLLKCSKPTIHRLEHDKKPLLSAWSLIDMAELFHMSIDELVKGYGRPEPARPAVKVVLPEQPRTWMDV